MGISEWFIEATGWPEISFGHTWFIEHLLLYSILYCLVMKLLGREEVEKAHYHVGFLHIVGLGTVIAIISAIIRIWYPLDEWIGILGFIQTEVGHLPQYIILFIIGILAFKNDWFDRVGKSLGYLSLGIGGLMATIVYIFGALGKFITVSVISVLLTYVVSHYIRKMLSIKL